MGRAGAEEQDNDDKRARPARAAGERRLFVLPAAPPADGPPNSGDRRRDHQFKCPDNRSADTNHWFYFHLPTTWEPVKVKLWPETRQVGMRAALLVGFLPISSCRPRAFALAPADGWCKCLKVSFCLFSLASNTHTHTHFPLRLSNSIVSWRNHDDKQTRQPSGANKSFACGESSPKAGAFWPS